VLDAALAATPSALPALAGNGRHVPRRLSVRDGGIARLVYLETDRAKIRVLHQ
jgi:hypothetical protein